ncbi:gamma-mobile-trio integrase GmtZ [Marinomonas sp.]
MTTQTYSLMQLKMKCKALGITNSVEYKRKYKNHPGFPAHPERVFASEWISYNHFFDIPEFVDYSSLEGLIAPLKLKNQREYKAFVKAQNDPTIPFTPHEVYGDDWTNWYRFLGKEEPFRTDYITNEYVDWKVRIEEFMKIAKGGASKITAICRFVRLYIEKNKISPSPEAFLRLESPNLKPLKHALDKFSDNTKRTIILASNEFLDFVLDKYLTIEDEDTGEIIRVMGARNPIALFLTDQSISSPQRSESNKPCLPYHFVKKAQLWLIPERARNFRDLKHIQSFDADWVKISKNNVDSLDPDCIYRKIGQQYYIWCPTDWIHLFALLKVPLRGRQIAYNDSGEADKKIADLDDSGKIIWIDNPSDLSGLTNNKSFIQRLPSDEIGMFVTTNKTSNNGEGYSIPWMPEDLAYWLIKLRKWQKKYNPITAPTKWIDCRRTNLNEIQLKAKGENCFLFRAYNDHEPKDPRSALTTRLAATLYNIQPNNLQIAKFNSISSNLSHYKSDYTPHSMRVSLITAYIMEMGMPVEVVMKIAGHSSVVMAIYYCKISNSDIRKKLEIGEKKALQEQSLATQKLIEQNKIESVKNTLVSNNQELISSLTNSVPAGNYIFRDYGICPFAASRCTDGGEPIGSTQVYAPTPSGYLGSQNCLRCRHFITGPAFIGGLLSITNEILLESNCQSEICHKKQLEIDAVEKHLHRLDEEEFMANARGNSYDYTERNRLENELRLQESEYESSAKKLDVLLCDLQSAYSLSKKCLAVANRSKSCSSSQPSLIKSEDSEIRLELEESSQFEQLHEICENATIYHSASAKRAILPRSQLLDRMATINNLAPSLFLLSEEEQLAVGNEICNLLKSRLGSWKRVNQVVYGDLRLVDLSGSEKIESSEIENAFQKPTRLLA